uniref:Uncharacterized protein n=1 Tax=Anguilla anguilla TaxID=7936 RepID=A0A0E9UCR9_ANGAN
MFSLINVHVYGRGLRCVISWIS